jgi:hypothetical protein
VAQPNQLNPIVQRVGIFGGTTTWGIFITGGSSTDSASIKVEIGGTMGTEYDYGTIYINKTAGTSFIAMPNGGGTFYKITAAA